MLFSSFRRRCSAFTLIEMLIVMGIIVLLIAIAFPVIGKLVGDGKRAKTKAEMGVIQTALEEYKKDHNGRYPQGEGLNSGFAVLARELVGVYGDGYQPGNPPTADPNDPPAYVAGKAYMPGDAVTNGGKTWVCMFDLMQTSKMAIAPGGTNNAAWADVRANDGADGPGTTITGQAGSKKVAYIPPDKFHVRGCALLDAQDNPILYFPARGNPNINKGINGNSSSPSFMAATSVGCKFDANDNAQFFARDAGPQKDIAGNNITSIKRIQALLGDFDVGGGGTPPPTAFNGIIDPGETAAYNGPYILWAPGPDNFYGPNATEAQIANEAVNVKRAIEKCDDLVLTP